MIERRHQIVHRADHPSLDAQDAATMPIEASDVSRWVNAAVEFAENIVWQLSFKVADKAYDETHAQMPDPISDKP